MKNKHLTMQMTENRNSKAANKEFKTIQSKCHDFTRSYTQNFATCSKDSTKICYS